MNRRTFLALPLAAPLLSLTGCGGGNNKLSTSSTKGVGRAVITILWPKTKGTSRFIHDAATTARIQVKSGDTLISSVEKGRPTDGSASTITFDQLPLYPLTFVAEAYIDPKVVLSRQKVTQKLTAGQPGQIAFTLDNQTDHVDVRDDTGTPITTLTMDLNQNKTKQLTAVSKDASGAIELLDSTNPQGFSWKSDNERVATVDPTSGLITAQKSGRATITAQEKGSPQDQGKSASVAVTVADPNSLTGDWVAWYGDNTIAYNTGGIQLSISEDTDGNISGSVLFNHAREAGTITGKRTGTHFQIKTIYSAPGQYETFDGSVTNGGMSATGTITGYGGDLGNKTVPFQMVREGQPVLVLLQFEGGPKSGTISIHQLQQTAVLASTQLSGGQGQITTSLPHGDYIIQLDYTADQAFESQTYTSGTVNLTNIYSGNEEYLQGTAGSGTCAITMHVD